MRARRELILTLNGLLCNLLHWQLHLSPVLLPFFGLIWNAQIIDDMELLSIDLAFRQPVRRSTRRAATRQAHACHGRQRYIPPSFLRLMDLIDYIFYNTPPLNVRGDTRARAGG